MSSTLLAPDPFMVGLLPVVSVGFTGTRDGMTASQSRVTLEVLQEVQPQQAHHGDCIGADTDFHRLIRDYLTGVMIIGHPPKEQRNRAFNGFDIMREPKDYHVRDKDIVYESQLLIATPKGEEYVRSGTWTTIRFARERMSAIKIIWPDGSVKDENF
jgi:hypothetical protein